MPTISQKELKETVFGHLAASYVQQADDNDTQPSINQPGGEIAVRMQLAGCMMKSHVPDLLKFIDQLQCMGHGCQCILAIGNQLVRQQGKCPMGGSTQKAGDWDISFLERKKINRKPRIFLYPTVTSPFPAKRAFGSDEMAKIDPPLKKGFFVFPDI